MEPHRVLQETAYPSLAYGLFGLGRFLQQIPDSYKRVIFYVDLWVRPVVA
jgi:hypothetical protein